MPIVVVSGPQDTNDQVIKKFKKKVLQDDLVTQIRDRQFHKNPSVLKKEKLTEFRRRKRRRLAMKRRAK